jgi:hypothetical protein
VARSAVVGTGRRQGRRCSARHRCAARASAMRCLMNLMSGCRRPQIRLPTPGSTSNSSLPSRHLLRSELSQLGSSPTRLPHRDGAHAQVRCVARGAGECRVCTAPTGAALRVGSREDQTCSLVASPWRKMPPRPCFAHGLLTSSGWIRAELASPSQGRRESTGCLCRGEERMRNGFHCWKREGICC